MVQQYKNAIVKFNSGHGALLCNIIIDTGFNHDDVPQYCTHCEVTNEQNQIFNGLKKK